MTTNNVLCGAFLSIPIDSSVNEWVTDEKSVLFSLKKLKKYTLSDPK